MDREMININANLVKESEFSEFKKDARKCSSSKFCSC